MKKLLSVFLLLTLMAGCIPATAVEPVDVMYVDTAIASDWNDFKKKTAEEGGISHVRARSQNHVWGREGYSGILNMAAMFDGVLTIEHDVVTEWGIKSLSARYDADAKATPSGKYNSLLGYIFTSPVSVDYVRVFFSNDGALEAFDVLGGRQNADGSITWTVLLEGTDLQGAGGRVYDDSTSYVEGAFPALTIDYVQIGFVDALANDVYLSEMQLYQAGTGGASTVVEPPAPETTAAPVTTAKPVTTAPPVTTAAPAEPDETVPARVTTALPEVEADDTLLWVLGIMSAAAMATLAVCTLLLGLRQKKDQKNYKN